MRVPATKQRVHGGTERADQKKVHSRFYAFLSKSLKIGLSFIPDPLTCDLSCALDEPD